jgi:hypothetical protein
MIPKLPADLPRDPAAAYLRGWQDRAALPGKSSSRRKAAAARRNGKKGGRPRKVR